MTFHSELFLLTSHLNLSQLAVVLVGGTGRRHLCRICFAGNRRCGAGGRRRRGREHCVYNGDVLMRRVREPAGAISTVGGAVMSGVGFSASRMVGAAWNGAE